MHPILMSGLVGLGNNLLERVFSSNETSAVASASTKAGEDFSSALQRNSRTFSGAVPGNSLLMPGEGPQDALQRLTHELSGLPEVAAFAGGQPDALEGLELSQSEQGRWVLHDGKGRQLVLSQDSRAAEIASQMHQLQQQLAGARPGEAAAIAPYMR
jgi:hypothetical protein